MSLRAAYAKAVLQKYVLQKYNESIGDPTNKKLPPINESSKNKDYAVPSTAPPKVGIIGAGASGLAVARLLQQSGTPIESIEILEASAGPGGRCYTYNFKAGDDCPHNYYDVGAMRIPDIDTMASTFAMIKDLEAAGQDVPLADYEYDNDNAPSLYAYGQMNSSAPGYDKFNTYMQQVLTQNQFLNPSVGFETAFENFMNSTSPSPDIYSTRANLMLQQGFTYEETENAETFDTSTGLFDQAFMETLCDFFDFQVAKKWHRVDGGMQKLTTGLFNVVTEAGANFTPNTAVVAMVDNPETNQIDVTWAEPKTGSPVLTPKSYDVVFNTTSFGCLEQMDLSGLNFDPWAFTGIRALSYDRATKVAIKFSTPWWMPQLTANGGPPGGVSSSDLPISNVVYPSWNDGSDTPHVIIVSYSWAQDATRMASRIAVNNVEQSGPAGLADPIIQLLFQNLEHIWAQTDTKITVEDLRNSYVAHHSFAWAHDPYTADAFALFGPGQFSQMYPQFLQPFCNNKLWICGEATSVHHAWISGAFDAAALAVNGWFHANGDTEAKKSLKASPLAGGKQKVPLEMDETLLYWNVQLAQKRELQRRAALPAK